MIEPVDPFQHRLFDGIQRALGAVRVDNLGLEQTDDRLGHGVVVGIADAADRGLDAVRGQSLAVSNR